MDSDTRPKYLNLSGRIFEFPPTYRVMLLQSLPKNQQFFQFFHLILMKLEMMLEVEETFTMI